MSEKLQEKICMMINNTARMITFAVLAVVFKHWWIILLSAIFLYYEKDKKYE